LVDSLQMAKGRHMLILDSPSAVVGGALAYDIILLRKSKQLDY